MNCLGWLAFRSRGCGGSASEGIRYIGTRHEQAAGYAAQAMSYLKGESAPVSSSPDRGMTNAISALGNAWANCWPMLLMGLVQSSLNHMGDSRTLRSGAGTPLSKWVGQAERIELIPRYIARQCATPFPGSWASLSGLTGDIISSRIEEDKLDYPPRVKPPPRQRSIRPW